MKITKILTPMLMGAALIATTNEASAQRRGGKMIDKIFEKLDANKDGKITKDEAGERWKRLSRADANNDGAVTKDELKAQMGKRKKRGKRRKKKK